MAEILKGKPVADAIKDDVKRRVRELKEKGCTPTLGIIRVGERADDLYYEGGAKKTCAAVDVATNVFAYPQDIPAKELKKAVAAINARADIHGILLFSPLPAHLPEDEIRALIAPEKDVDSLTVASAAKIFIGDKTGFPPCTPQAVMELFNCYDIPVQGKNVVVIGRSLVVGKPLAMLLLGANATVTVCHSKTGDLPGVCRKADILIAAIGRAKMIDNSFVSKGQIVIDVGINEDPEAPGKYCGDVDFEAVAPIVKAITPVPGGIGSVTTAVLIKHTVKACMLQNGLA